MTLEWEAQRQSTGRRGWVDVLWPGHIGVEHKSAGLSLTTTTVGSARRNGWYCQRSYNEHPPYAARSGEGYQRLPDTAAYSNGPGSSRSRVTWQWYQMTGHV